MLQPCLTTSLTALQGRVTAIMGLSMPQQLSTQQQFLYLGALAVQTAYRCGVLHVVYCFQNAPHLSMLEC